jgi:putative (di)nucleoside polyphosphate hydrolase
LPIIANPIYFVIFVTYETYKAYKNIALALEYITILMQLMQLMQNFISKIGFNRMLDRFGYRPNVCIVIVNKQQHVLMCKRIHEQAWQFPQGGIRYQERPIDAMYRELFEEIGLLPEHVDVLGRTKNWLYYDVPVQLLKSQSKIMYKGQKQIWYLLRMLNDDNIASVINLETSDKPEFDAYDWYDYWQASNIVIDFKKDVYELAMHELYAFI